jgi:hypothetical protein
MRISLAESNRNGFNKWCAAHDAGSGDDGRLDAVDIVDQAIETAVMTPPEQPHRPWLVPGAGTL